MIRRPPRSTRTYTLFPYTTLFRSASGMGDIWRGGLLLLVYGLSMTAPFVVAALFAKPFLRWLGRHRSKLQYAEKIMGGMLILFAILIATNGVRLIADVMIRWMPSLTTLG